MRKILTLVSFIHLSFISSSLYNLSSPEKTFDLPKELVEVSGIIRLNESEIGCIQDETGIFYIYNLIENKISNKIKFAEKGDFEDVTIVGEKAYVLESTGKLYCFNINTSSPGIRIFNIEIPGEKDAESLCYDQKNNRLLFAFKASGKKEKNKSIYAFDLSTEKALTTSVINISLNNLSDLIDGKKKKRARKNERNFQPSGMAIHPVTGSLYLISAQNSTVLITNVTGNIENAYHLDPKIFPQPEGITFALNGDMYISNEGNKSGATILKFIYVR